MTENRLQSFKSMRSNFQIILQILVKARVQLEIPYKSLLHLKSFVSQSLNLDFHIFHQYEHLKTFGKYFVFYWSNSLFLRYSSFCTFLFSFLLSVSIAEFTGETHKDKSECLWYCLVSKQKVEIINNLISSEAKKVWYWNFVNW